MSQDIQTQPTEVQIVFSEKVKTYLEHRGILSFDIVFQPGQDSGAVKITFNRLVIFIYEDGGAEISSLDRIDRTFKFIPIRIDWRFEVEQYFPQDKLEREFFVGLDEAIGLMARKI